MTLKKWRLDNYTLKRICMCRSVKLYFENKLKKKANTRYDATTCLVFINLVKTSSSQ